MLIFLFKIAVAAALMVWLLASGRLEPSRIGRAVVRGPGWAALAFLLLNAAVVVTALRWRMLLRSHGLQPTAWACIRMTYIGCFFSSFLPGGTGGDIVKAYYAARDAHKRAEAATTVFVDRLGGLYCLMGLATAAVLTQAGRLWRYPSGRNPELPALGLSPTQLLVVAVLAAFAAATVGLLVFLSSHCRRLVHWLLDHLPPGAADVLKRVYDAAYHYRGQGRLLLLFALCSLCAQVLVIGALWGIGVSLNDPLACGGTRALYYLFLIPLGGVFAGLPIAPAGVGVFEWALAFLFATVLASGEANVGASVAALGHVLILLTNLLGIVFYLRHKHRGPPG